MSILGEASKNIINLPRYAKRLIAIITDVSLCILCTWLAFLLRLEELILLKNFNFYPALISIFVAIPIFWLFGLYRTIFRYTSLSLIFSILISSTIYGLLYFLVIGAYSIEQVPRSIGIIQPVLLFFFIISSRLVIKYLFIDYNLSKSFRDKKNVAIYGAGDAGRQLLISLENNPQFKVVGFLDDNESLHGQLIVGQTVFSISNIKDLIKKKDISLVFLALPSIPRVKRNQIIEKLNEYKLIVKTLPTVSEIVDNRVTLSDVKDLNIEDLLNRDEVAPDNKLLNENINYRTVAVTGAGGSIGSELCRQIIKLNPKKLLLLEFNEYALYKIFEELKNSNKNLKIFTLLVNVQNQSKLEEIFEVFKVDTVYHSAAYKHVPIVEENMCEGIKNNVFGTLSVTKASINKKVSNLVLISSDKAVRPTNIMGASKRLSELCLQGIYNHTKDITINCSIVRFGNVLESSGSVIPKFRKQIKEGGPITLTHRDVTRYFMTITEAAQLVIQAGAMGKKCEVFVLDMGESIKIINLIYNMIKLSGFTVKDKKNLEGDIEIKTTGLRPGEKLYEELLIGDDPKITSHIKIKKTNDPFIPFEKLEIDLNDLKLLLEKNKIYEVKNLMNKILPSYNSNSGIVDHIYQEKLNINNNLKPSSIVDNQENKIIKIRTK